MPNNGSDWERHAKLVLTELQHNREDHKALEKGHQGLALQIARLEGLTAKLEKCCKDIEKLRDSHNALKVKVVGIAALVGGGSAGAIKLISQVAAG